MRIGAIIVAAGRGERLGAGMPKGMIEIDGVPLLLISMAPFQLASSISEIALVVPDGYEETVARLTARLGFDKIVGVVRGGLERQNSVEAGLGVLSATTDAVLIHDGARPLTGVALIERVCASLGTHKAAFAGLPVSDTLHVNRNGIAVEGLDRSQLVAAQTPQGFHRTQLEEAFKIATTRKLLATDEVSLLRQTHHIHAAIIPGETGNIKITRAEDLEFYLPQIKLAVERMRVTV